MIKKYQLAITIITQVNVCSSFEERKISKTIDF